MRKINKGNLIIQGILYRVYILIFNYLFILITTGNFNFALKGALIINTLNLTLYFIYHYIFAKNVSLNVPDKGFVLWFTGLPCSGKTTLAKTVKEKLNKLNKKSVHLDGDYVRETLCSDLGFSKKDRETNLQRVTFVASYLSKNDIIVLSSFVSPYRAIRGWIRSQVTNYIEVYVRASIATCIARDVKGMWKKAMNNEITCFTGWSDVYEAPLKPEIHIDTEIEDVEYSADKIITYLKDRKLI